VRERIEYRFRVPSAAVFTLYSYSKTLVYRLEYATAGSLTHDSLLILLQGLGRGTAAATILCSTFFDGKSQ
jgi:hypothetical protein